MSLGTQPLAISVANLLSLFMGPSELGLAIFRRAKAGATSAADRGSLRLLWAVIFLGVGGAFFLAYAEPSLGFRPELPFVALGVLVFVAGIVLRWYSIVYLGRFFTVDVAIARDHRLIDSGPYRHIRHPSYTGALLGLSGIGLCLCNAASLAAIVIPTAAVFVWRMHVEEQALREGLGDVYRDYMRRTRRLIPLVY
jgi:protein-S-isoprenylcysteine O-methyltransferase